MSEWEVYLNKHDAATNLAIDDYLLDKASKENKKSLRIYEFEKPSVILARNESFSDIKNIKNQIDYTRRDTGGSAIYCDKNAVFYSIITPLENEVYPEEIHRDYFGPKIADTLADLGVEEEKLGVGEHFSIRINGKTVSGNSQRRKKDSILYHGVLAVEKWDINQLEKVIQLREKEGQSEREFIKSLPGLFEHTKYSNNKTIVKQKLIENLTQDNYTHKDLKQEEIEEINNIVHTKYGNEEWIKNGGNSEILKEDQGFCFVDWTDEWKEKINDYGFY